MQHECRSGVKEAAASEQSQVTAVAAPWGGRRRIGADSAALLELLAHVRQRTGEDLARR